MDLLLLHELFMFFHVWEILSFDKVMLFSPLPKCYFSVSLIIKTYGLEVLLFWEFINIIPIFIIALL